MAPLDKLQHEIHVGDIIAYGHTLHSSALLSIGKVLSFKRRQDFWDGTPQWSISVQGVDDDYSLHEHMDMPPRLKKAGTLLYPERTVVLPASLIPTNYKQLLGEVK